VRRATCPSAASITRAVSNATAPHSYLPSANKDALVRIIKIDAKLTVLGVKRAASRSGVIESAITLTGMNAGYHLSPLRLSGGYALFTNARIFMQESE